MEKRGKIFSPWSDSRFVAYRIRGSKCDVYSSKYRCRFSFTRMSHPRVFSCLVNDFRPDWLFTWLEYAACGYLGRDDFYFNR